MSLLLYYKSENPKGTNIIYNGCNYIWYTSCLIPMQSSNPLDSTMSVTNLATTTFLDAEPENAVILTAPPPSSLDNQVRTITSFLEKPLQVFSGAWSALSSEGALILNVDPATYLTSGPWLNKLEGFRLVRGNAHLRLTLNANPFQAGRIIMSFYPMTDTVSSSLYISRFNSLTTITQLPNIEMSTTDSVVELSVPYINTINYWINQPIIGETQHTWGDFNVHILSALYTGASGQNEVDVTAYLYFTDIELSAPMEPQSRVGKFKKSKIKSLAEKEDDEMTSHPISAGLGLVSKVSTLLGHVVPTLSAVTGPVSWAAAFASDVASSYGWSKPAHNIIPAPVASMTLKHMANADGAASAFPLAVVSTNQLRILDNLTPYEGDEMSIDFLKTRRCYFGKFPWSTYMARGATLWTHYANPSQYYEQLPYVAGTHTYTFRCEIPLTYMTNFFGYWRGGIELTLKFIKTQFHAGRAELIFLPCKDASAAAISDVLLDFREVIDLQTVDEVTFTLPYLLPTEYTSGSIGTLVMRVINPLRCPETVSQAIQILCYANGAPDFEYAGPKYLEKDTMTNGVIPQPFVPRALTSMITQQLDEPMTTQSGLSGVLNKSKVETPQHAELSMGEKVVSLKQLLNRNHILVPNGTATVWDNGVLMWPWFCAVTTNDVTTGAIINNQSPGLTIFDFIAPMYAVMRGGVRIMSRLGTTNATNPQGVNVEGTLLIDQTTFVAGATAIKAPITLSGQVVSTSVNWPLATSSAVADLTGTSLYEVPYYSKYKAMPVNPGLGALTVPGDAPQVGINLRWSGFKSSNTNTVTVYRSFRDDFQLSYFVGCPPVLVGYI